MSLLTRFDGLRLVWRFFSLLSVARRLELDPAETDAALRERRFRERVLADIESGRRAGVHATPTFFLGGERVDRPWRELPQIVRAGLARA